MKLVSWQSTLTEHQVHLMHALHKDLVGALEIVVGTRLLAVRSAQGWTEASTGELEVRYLQGEGWWAEGRALIDANRDAFHLFGGIWADRRFLPLMLYAQFRGVATGLMTEPYSEAAVGYFGGGQSLATRLKSVLRPLAYRIAGALLGARLKVLLAISTLAARQFSEAGFPAQCIYPFGYFVPKLSPPGKHVQTLVASGKRSIRLVFVGSLVERKGVSHLIEAFRSVHGDFDAAGVALTLDIYGSGALSPGVEAPAGVTVKGLIPFGEAQAVISQYDALVLPSLHDGWGVVVNEALLQGVPVIVSDAVGAQAPVLKAGAGAVIPAGDCAALAKCFRSLLESPERLLSWKSGAQAISDSLAPEVAATYLLACLKHACGTTAERPIAPWYP
jgi:glycosyltransferase involved in cell wall biosynthesis